MIPETGRLLKFRPQSRLPAAFQRGGSPATAEQGVKGSFSFEPGKSGLWPEEAAERSLNVCPASFLCRSKSDKMSEPKDKADNDNVQNPPSCFEQ
jgi:hypothetical protein